MPNLLSKKIALFSIGLLLLLSSTGFIYKPLIASKSSSCNTFKKEVTLPSLYQILNLNTAGLSKQAYDFAILGLDKLNEAGKIKNDKIISIIDFSLPSSAKRLFVIDIEHGILLFNTYVAHGRNSGAGMANEFSNSPESFKSSLGFYVTSETYMGKHGYALRLEGEEKGINDNALSRGIVMHSAAYVSENTIHSLGYLGRSQGCPAVPEECYQAIIGKIKNGTCLFMYSPVKEYASNSILIKENNKL